MDHEPPFLKLDLSPDVHIESNNDTWVIRVDKPVQLLSRVPWGPVPISEPEDLSLHLEEMDACLGKGATPIPIAKLPSADPYILNYHEAIGQYQLWLRPDVDGNYKIPKSVPKPLVDEFARALKNEATVDGDAGTRYCQLSFRFVRTAAQAARYTSPRAGTTVMHPDFKDEEYASLYFKSGPPTTQHVVGSGEQHMGKTERDLTSGPNPVPLASLYPWVTYWARKTWGHLSPRNPFEGNNHLRFQMRIAFVSGAPQ